MSGYYDWNKDSLINHIYKLKNKIEDLENEIQKLREEKHMYDNWVTTPRDEP